MRVFGVRVREERVFRVRVRVGEDEKNILGLGLER